MAIEQLSAQPSMAGLYAKAAAGALPGRGRGEAKGLPEVEYLLDYEGAAVKPVADYARLCGFDLRNELPGSYLHLPVFGMQLLLMTQPDFPLPLLGAVHVANSIEVHRAVSIGEAVQLHLRAANLSPHRRGATVELHAEARSGDEVVWREVSTYLGRGVTVTGTGGGKAGETEHDGTGHDPERNALADGGEPAWRTAAQQVTPSVTWRLRGDVGRRYAEVSGDRNPIHLSAASAKAFGFPRAIAHGMYTAARGLAALSPLLPPAYRFEVAFGKPVTLPATVGFGWQQQRTDAPSLLARLAGRDAELTHLTAAVTPL